MPVISLYWFDVDQEIGTLRHEKYDLVYSRFNAKFNDLGPSL